MQTHNDIMNAKRKVVLVVAALVLLSAPAAQAFYNPHTGRWLSRDPIHEFGHRTQIKDQWMSGSLEEDQHLYRFVLNRPADHYDRDGRVVGYVVGLVAAATYTCAKPQYNEAFRRYPDSGDKFKHCWVSCRISKTCGGGVAELAGLSKEARDLAIAAYCKLHPESEICQGDQGGFWDSLTDLMANQACVGWESALGPAGGWVGALCRRSCEDCCKARVGYYAGKP